MTPMIPSSPEDLPLEYEVIPEDTPCRGVIREFKIAEKTDKNNKHYGVILWEIITPVEFEGRQITDNYVGFQDFVDSLMSDSQRRRALEHGIQFNRVCAGIRIKPSMIPCNPMTPNEVPKVNEFLSEEFVGQEGDFSVSVDVYKGRKNNKIKEYFLP